MNKLFSELLSPYLPLIRQILRFGMVGLTAASIHFCVVLSLVQMTGLNPLIANIFGFLVAFQFGYWGHRLWTFNGTVTLHSVALPKLMLVQLISFTTNEALFYFFLSLKLPYPLALLCVLTILPIFTFLSSKLWVFR